MIECFYGHSWINNHSWINAGQQFGGYGPDLFSALPLEIQMRILRSMGPDVFKTLEAMERVSHAWFNIASTLWEPFVRERFSQADIVRAQKRLTDLRRNPQDWRSIAALLVPFDVRISFFTDLPDSSLASVEYIWLSIPDGRTLQTLEDIRPGERIQFYDSNTSELVATIPLRLLDAPWSFQAWASSYHQTVFGEPSTIIVHPYKDQEGVRKRITAIRIINDGKSIRKLTAVTTTR